MMRDRPWLHALLFVLTFGSTMMAGTAWAMQDYTDISLWGYGVTYALLIMSFLTAHEFGHYVAARIHGVDATLPFFIPMPFIPMIPFGTMGAVIRTRAPIPNRKVLFDIGVSGPLAGFVVCLLILTVGIITLPPFESIYAFHPEYRLLREIPHTGMYFGDIPILNVFRWIAATYGKWVPPMNEMYHYPFLCVGWFGLFVTALNMAPFGNLDGGHVLYALTGSRIQRVVARTAWWVMFVAGLLSLLGIVDAVLQEPSPNEFIMSVQNSIGMSLHNIVTSIPWLFQAGEGWLLWSLIIRFVIKIEHPEIPEIEPLSFVRSVVGWLAIAILLLSLPLRMVYFV